MKRLPFIFVFLALASCNSGPTPPVSYEVHHFGALKHMMKEGDLSAKADLNDLSDLEHVYALGAFENLKGEIQIFDGKPENTRVKGSFLIYDKTYSEKAALLVYASVKKWKTIEIPKEVVFMNELEEFVAKAAEQRNINTDEPFPFLLEGTARAFDWHVINWKEGDTAHSHEKHIKSGMNGTAENRAVKMLGFYSDSHHSIFTHHTTNMHIHVQTHDQLIAGHVDDLVLGPGMILKLPDE